MYQISTSKNKHPIPCDEKRFSLSHWVRLCRRKACLKLGKQKMLRTNNTMIAEHCLIWKQCALIELWGLVYFDIHKLIHNAHIYGSFESSPTIFLLLVKGISLYLVDMSAKEGLMCELFSKAIFIKALSMDKSPNRNGKNFLLKINVSNFYAAKESKQRQKRLFFFSGANNANI